MSNSQEKQNKPLISQWQSPSNIALVKYWGKHGRQLPRNASVSFTLSEACTKTKVMLTEKTQQEEIELALYFEGIRNPSFESRVRSFLQQLVPLFFPWVREYAIRIDTANTFPHSSGIASSAAGMSALALCLCDLDRQLRNATTDDESFKMRASLISRLGSGSASRSLYPKLAAWGVHESLPASSDMYAIGLEKMLHPVFQNYHDDILIVSEKEKSVSSSAGHQLMENNPYASARYQQAQERMTRLLRALQDGDVTAFLEITEEEALTLHALMMCSSPSFMLMEPETMKVIREIRNFRKETGVPVCFTLDAGPNVHILYPHSEASQVSAFIRQQVLPVCPHGRVLQDWVGDGPRLIPEQA